MPSVWLPSIAHQFPPYNIMGRAQFLQRNCSRFILSQNKRTAKNFPSRSFSFSEHLFGDLYARVGVLGVKVGAYLFRVLFAEHRAADHHLTARARSAEQ